MNPDYTKSPDGLVPVIVQDVETSLVLMLGYMNAEAYEKTCREKRITFFSRSKNRLWTKGETSGNFLEVSDIFLDCDRDTILIRAKPLGPVCHNGTESCFGEGNKRGFLSTLEAIIQERKDHPAEKSYTSRLFREGTRRIAQKVGEEAVELVIEAMDDQPELFISEAADLLFHYLVLLRQKGVSLSKIISQLESRHAIKR